MKALIKLITKLFPTTAPHQGPRFIENSNDLKENIINILNPFSRKNWKTQFLRFQ